MNTRLTVKDLTARWRADADDLAQDDPRADQLRACAKDLEATQSHHTLIEDPDVSRSWWKR
jgi:hypothetical protein